MSRKPMIYVSGPSKELERCERAIARCRELGAGITFDWTIDMRQESEADTASVRHLRAACDLQGVADCDVMLFLDSEGASPGRWVEFGAAYAGSKPIVGSVSSSSRPYIWHELLLERHSSDEFACLRACQIAQEILNVSK